MEYPFLSLIVPTYNEASRVVSTLEKLTNYLTPQPYSWEIIVVDDGSEDDTAKLTRDWTNHFASVKLIPLRHGGKGWAVMNGMLAAKGAYRIMCDADLSMDVKYIGQFLETISKGYDVVIGSREITGAVRYDEPIERHVIGRVFNWTVKLLRLSDFQDTQCGFKCFTGDVADFLFSRQRTKGWGFDVEILHLAALEGLMIFEMPISWHYREDSKIRANRDSIAMLKDVLLVKWRSHTGIYSQEPPIQCASYKTNSVPKLDHLDGQVAIIVPTYNEAANLPELIKRIFSLSIPNMRLIIVDDGSPDHTSSVAKNLAKRYLGQIIIVQRPCKQGIGTAYTEGFSKALAEGARYVLQMDADLSHPPECIPYMLESLKESEVSVGSRYIEGGEVTHPNGHWRHLLSLLGNWGIRAVAGIETKDVTSGFKAFRGDTLRRLNFKKFRCKGFGFQAEMTYACERLNVSVNEHPIVFNPRTRGESKMSIYIVLETMWNIAWLRWKNYID